MANTPKPAGPPPISHYIPYDTPRYNRGRQAKAACGRIVDCTTHSLEPTCADCATLRLDHDRDASEAL